MIRSRWSRLAHAGQ